MKLHIQQAFPLGRFHANAWKSSPYDDPHGEWPPSPWRLLRACLARSFQLERESGLPGLQEALLSALRTSSISWYLPASTGRGPGIRQYQPADFKRVPAGADEPGMMTYNTTKVQDNFWITPPDAPLTWIIDGGDWTPELAQLLASCLDRMTYFGRAESITETRLLTAPPNDLVPNCVLKDRHTGTAVPVLCWSPDVTLEQVLLTSDEAKTNPPPGAIWRYAERPDRPPIKPRHTTIHRSHQDMHFIQFAIGSHVAPRYADTVRITERFRTRMLGRFVERLSGQRTKGNAWGNATPEIKALGTLLSGKQVDGTPLQGHRHPYIFLYGEPERPTRLCIWRTEPFTDDEQAAILSAASHPLELSYKNDPWTITLVPLDHMVPKPPGFDQQASTRWQTLTPWVPPCHALDKKGRPKPGQSLEEQLQKELSQHEVSLAKPAIIERAGWVKSHQPTSSRRDNGPTNNSKLGFNVVLSLATPHKGPLILGHSSHFGLGLLVPTDG